MPQEESEPKTLSPFKVINRGEDTIVDDDVVFADFSPKVLPADAPDEVVDEILIPKAESAPEPALSPELVEKIEPVTSESPVPTPAEEVDGDKSQSDLTSQSSSTGPKSGPKEQPA